MPNRYDRVVSRASRRLAGLVAGAALAFVLAAGSVTVHRQVHIAPLSSCDARPMEICRGLLTAGGWPFPFLYDNLGTSVVGELGVEDDIKPGWFLVDMAIFTVVPAFGMIVVARMRRARPVVNRA